MAFALPILALMLCFASVNVVGDAPVDDFVALFEVVFVGVSICWHGCLLKNVNQGIAVFANLIISISILRAGCRFFVNAPHSYSALILAVLLRDKYYHQESPERFLANKGRLKSGGGY